MSMQSAANVLRRSEYRETPWRNGGGTTFEIARGPAGDGVFDWRLSLARIDRNGPFSDFTGYQRALTLVSGGGCRLHGADARPRELRESGATLLFPGALTVNCELLEGPSSDLNLMVREPGRIVSVEHFSLLAYETEALRPDCFNAVFCLSGVIECLHMRHAARLTLGAHDTFIADAADAGDWRLLRGAGDHARAVVHAWRCP